MKTETQQMGTRTKPYPTDETGAKRNKRQVLENETNLYIHVYIYITYNQKTAHCKVGRYAIPEKGNCSPEKRRPYYNLNVTEKQPHAKGADDAAAREGTAAP